jgi:hypothetical protein
MKIYQTQYVVKSCQHLISPKLSLSLSLSLSLYVYTMISIKSPLQRGREGESQKVSHYK